MIRPGPDPAFWLRLLTPDGPRELDLDVLDAFALLLLPHPVAVTTTGASDRDDALCRLVDEEQ